MATDISSNLSAEIDAGKTFANSDNLRCGKNRFMVTNIRGELIDNGNAKNEYAFVEMIPLTSEPNPQIEGDWVLEGKLVPAGTTGAKLVDDGTTPNRAGAPCAVKANFTGNRNVAATKIKQFFLAAFNVREGDTKPGEIGGAWEDASRQVAGYYVKGWKLGDNVVPPGTPNAVEKWVNLVYASGGFVPVTKDTPGAVWKPANPLAGMVIDCVTKNHKKRTPNEKGSYVGVQNWTCVAPVGTGENSMEAMRERLAKYAPKPDDAADDDATAPQVPPPQTVAPQPPAAQGNGSVNGNGHAPTPPVPPVDPNWPPKAPWQGLNDGNKSWMKPGFVWDGGSRVITEAEYRAGKR